MDLKQLQALQAIADHGSFSGAAVALSTVQSNISTRIKALEHELDVVLVDRASGRLGLDFVAHTHAWRESRVETA